MASLIDKCVCVLTPWAAPLTGHSPISLPLLGPPYSLKYNTIKIRPINNLTVASKCSSERRSHISLTLHPKLEMVKLSEEGTSKAETSRKLGLLCQTVSQVVNAKEMFLKEIKSATPVNTWMIRKWNNLIAVMERDLVVWIEDQISHNIPLSQSIIQRKVLTHFNLMKAERGEEGTEKSLKLAQVGSWDLRKKPSPFKNTRGGEGQDGGRVRRGDHLPSLRYSRNTSTRGTVPTEHPLNAGRRPQTSQQTPSGDLHTEAGPNPKLNPGSCTNKEEKGKSLPAASEAAD